MTSQEKPNTSKVLLVDDDEAVREMMTQTLQRKGFEVVAAANVTDALRCIATASFDVLITDLHMPHPGDGFTVVTAMRHFQPHSLTLIVSGYPDVQKAMDTIVLEADEIIVKPFEMKRLPDLIREKMLVRKPTARTPKERVGEILRRCKLKIVEDWLARAKESNELNHLQLTDEERTGHLPKLIEDLIARLNKPIVGVEDGDTKSSNAAAAHGVLRYEQHYTPEMLVHESRILQVTLFGTLQNNLSSIDFSLLLPDVMKIADEVDAQLMQTMGSYCAGCNTNGVGLRTTTLLAAS